MATSSGTMLEVGSGGGLVLGTLAGDRVAFAHLHDRFATPRPGPWSGRRPGPMDRL